MTEQEAKRKMNLWSWRAEEQWMLARPKLVRQLKQKQMYYQLPGPPGTSRGADVWHQGARAGASPCDPSST